MPMPSSGVWKMMKVAVVPLRSWSISLSSIITSAMQPVGRQRTKPARPTSAWSTFRPRPGGQQHAERRDDAQQPALAVGRLQHDHHEIDVRPVLGRDALDQRALLLLGAGRRLAAHLPVAVLLLHDALGAGGDATADSASSSARRSAEPTSSGAARARAARAKPASSALSSDPARSVESAGAHAADGVAVANDPPLSRRPSTRRDRPSAAGMPRRAIERLCRTTQFPGPLRCTSAL